MSALRGRLLRFSQGVSRLLVPGLRNSQFAYYQTLKQLFNAQWGSLELWSGGQAAWLDIGCGHHVFGHWMEREQAEILRKCRFVVGADLELEAVRKHRGIKNKVLADLRSVPFKPASFDLITANMVFEHLEDPTAVLSQIGLLLKPDGLVVFHTPNLRNYLVFAASLVPGALKRRITQFLDGRADKDIFPTSYRINTPGRVRELAQGAGFKVLQLSLVNSSPVTAMLGPLVVVELLITRLLNLARFRNCRSNIIALLQKTGSMDRAGEVATPRRAAAPAPEEVVCRS